MPNLKDIRRRIKSVKSTEKITLAMKMVAAAKVKRAENKLKANQPYAKGLHQLFVRLYDKLAQQDIEDLRLRQLVTPRQVKSVGIVIVGADRGLCGSYSSSVLKQALLLEKQYREQGIEPKFYVVGNKLIRTLPIFSQAGILGQLGNMTAAPSIYDAEQITNTLVDAYVSGEIDSIQILYTRFVSMISYKVSLMPLLPAASNEFDAFLTQMSGIDAATEVLPQGANMVNAELLIEPNAEQVLSELLPLYLQNITYATLLESSASELAARMTAMSNASKNATELIGQLTLVYNKVRQAAITQEILEIVGGANAI